MSLPTADSDVPDQLVQSDEKTTFLPAYTENDEEEQQLRKLQGRRQRPINWYPHHVYISACLCALSAIFCVLSLIFYVKSLGNVDSWVSWSPALSALGPRQTITLHTPFYGTNEFKGEPSPSLEKAWNEITKTKVGFFTAEELRKAGQDPTKASKWPAKYGDGYVGQAEGLHQLHCLNFVRKATFHNGEYDDEPGFRLDRPGDKDPSFRMAREEDLRRHIDHCIDAIRNFLMCYADTSIKPFGWVKDYPRPVAINSGVHKCRNFTELVEWGLSRQFPREAYVALNPNDSSYVFEEFA